MQILNEVFLDRIRSAMTAANLFEDFRTTWACFGCELMPWSAKAQELLRSQYAAVGSAGRAALPQTLTALQLATNRSSGDAHQRLSEIQSRFTSIHQHMDQFVAAYRQYCCEPKLRRPSANGQSRSDLDCMLRSVRASK
jgi:hypothetical protein